MRKKTILILLVSISLVVIAAISFLQQKSGTIDNKFLIYDTASVEQLFLVNKRNEKINLRKENGQWYLGKNEAAVNDNVNTILKTLINIEIQRPVPKSSRNTVIKQLATNSVKVEVYQRVYTINLFGVKLFPKLKKTKTFYVGSPTRDYTGTIMMMENSEDIYITYIPGFNGYLTERFSPNYKDWINHSLFKIPIRDINQVKVEFGTTPEQSYEIKRSGNKDFSLTSLLNNKTLSYDTTRLLESLASFRDISYESLLDKMPSERLDSLKKSTPYCSITVKTMDQQTVKVDMYRRQNYTQKQDLNGVVFPYDIDRMYAILQGYKYPITVQYYIVDNISRPIDYLLGKSDAAKKGSWGVLSKKSN